MFGKLKIQSLTAPWLSLILSANQKLKLYTVPMINKLNH